MKKLLLFAMLLTTVTMNSCSKDAAKLTLVGKWKIVNLIYKTSTFNDTYNGLANDYFDFKSNGNLETSLDGDIVIQPYSINGSNVTIDGETFSISTLTTSATTLYYTQGTGSSKIEATYNLKK
jgi:hypothetical protein